MIKGISPCISPELLEVFAEMCHCDHIILTDAHSPGHALKARVLRADGLGIATLLNAILPLFELDSYAAPLVVMAAVSGDKSHPMVEAAYMKVVRRHVPRAPSPERIGRFAFYESAKKPSPLSWPARRRSMATSFARMASLQFRPD